MASSSFDSHHLPPPSPHLDIAPLGFPKRSASDDSGRRSFSDADPTLDLGFRVTSKKHETNVFESASALPQKAAAENGAAKHLPCPRCNSLDTKFCYYNNYNVNQPRHFCKNCQRYWTAGGTLRNIAVGAGRRKRKQNVAETKSVAIDSAAESCEENDSPGMKTSRTKLNLLTVKNEPVPGNLQPTNFHLPDMFSDEHVNGQNCNSLHGYTAPTVTRAFCGIGIRASPELKQMNVTVADTNIALQADTDANVDYGRLASESSSEKQQSTESACTSSITISQTAGKELCTSVTMLGLDIEVNKTGDDSNKNKQIKASKSGDESNKDRQIYASAKDEQDASIIPPGRSSSAFGFPQGDAIPHPLVSPSPLLWSLAVENCAVWPIVQQSTWAPPIDKSFSWSTMPWLPASMLINAAKVGLVNSAGTAIKQTSTDPERRLWFPKTLRINDPKDAALSSIWTTLGLESNELTFSSSNGVIDCNAKKAAIHARSQHAIPAALAQSMVFHERS